jgi:putative two-component system response regulator
MRVVIVEDNSTNLAVLCKMVSRMDGVTVDGFTGSLAALADAQCRPADLMIVDNVMPEMTGLELVAHLRGLPSHRHVPIIMVTADADRPTRLNAIEAGATDFLSKPVDAVELRSRVSNLLALRQAQNELARRAEVLAGEVAVATDHLQKREEEMIYRLARAIDLRDNETSEHVVRVACVAQIIATELGLDHHFVRTLWLAAPLHDIGKIGIADAILGKPGKLDAAEMAIMRQHATIGAAILEGGDSELIRMAEAVARSHHERWDGTGYPNNLHGQDIPLAARIAAIADVFDALCSERPYKLAWPLPAARAEIQRCSGSFFDPDCVAAFDRAWPQIEAIYASHTAAEKAA